MVEVAVYLDELLGLGSLKDATLVGASPRDLVLTAELSEPSHAVLLFGEAERLVAKVVVAGTDNVAPPAVVLSADADLVQALAEIMQALLQRSQVLAERSRAILQTLAEAEIAGRDIPAIVALLADLVQSPVTLKDPSLRVITWSGNPDDFDQARSDTVEAGAVPESVQTVLEHKGVLDRIRTSRHAFRIDREDEVGLAPRVVCPVRSGDVYHGHLSISEGHRRLNALDFTAVEHGAMILALHLSREDAVTASIRSQKALLVYELLFSPAPPSPASRRQADLLQVDLTLQFAVLAVMVSHSPAEATDHELWARTSSAIVGTIDRTLERAGVRSAIALPEDEGVLVIMPVHGHAPAVLAEILRREIAAYHSCAVTAVGISRTREGSSGLKDCYDEARLAAKLGPNLNGPGAVTHYTELGALRLLNEIQPDKLEEHLAATLGTDDQFRRTFLETYGALVNCGYNKAAAARQLFIHVNTLKYRLNRIRRLTGLDPRDQNGRFALECTLRLLELRKVQAPLDDSSGARAAG